MRSLDILVVDDETDLASGIAELLEAEGHRVALAATGEKALEIGRQHTFDMVFLDVKLPGVAGLAALRELRKTQAEARVMFMTGYRIDNLLDEVARDGGGAAVAVSGSVEEIVERIRALPEGGILLAAADGAAFGAELERSLGRSGLRVRLAETEAQSADALASGDAEVLVLDLDLPVARTLEICFAQEGGRTRKVLLARPAANESASGNPLRSVAVTGCLFKPFDPIELLRSVRAYAQQGHDR